MHDIDAPTAKRLLRTLPYEEWLPVGRMMIPKGIHTARVGSLEELLEDLDLPCERLLGAEHRGVIHHRLLQVLADRERRLTLAAALDRGDLRLGGIGGVIIAGGGRQRKKNDFAQWGSDDSSGYGGSARTSYGY